ncbi:Protein of unknown function [Cotesia congregata]|uniref:Uncharacterized protein n=1 Tax=Cotesia congregata TaxID=51543 RepID=A0A8J2HBY6_COTCN|nr:Protein of unknown function [Cotesia congregata]
MKISNAEIDSSCFQISHNNSNINFDFKKKTFSKLLELTTSLLWVTTKLNAFVHFMSSTNVESDVIQIRDRKIFRIRFAEKRTNLCRPDKFSIIRKHLLDVVKN